MEFRDLKKQYSRLKPEIDEQIADVIASSRYISGQQVNELESKLAGYVGTKYCISCGNGTDAISLALMAWNVGVGDAVFVPDFTFFSSGECPAVLGATPFFVDVDEHTYNIDPDKLEKAIEKVNFEGKYIPKVVVAVDLFGRPADYTRIISICKKYGLRLLEDGAQGFGGNINDRMDCSFGDISTTSFFPAKPLGCYGDGGAVFTDNDEWAELIRSMAVHGKSKTNKYDNLRLGMNSRLDTIQAAVLLGKFDAFKEYELADVNKAASRYNELLKDAGLCLPTITDGIYSSWAQYTVVLPIDVDRDSVQKSLREKDIPTMVYYMNPMHCQKAFDRTDSSIADCPVTERLCKTVLSLPMHPYITDKQIEFVSESLRELIQR